MNYTVIKDVLYRKVNETELFLDIYLPKETNYEKLPCCVFFHGGGWIEGGKEDVHGYPLIFDELINAGFAVASVQYRLVGKNGGEFPSSVIDGLYALKFLDEQKLFPINRFRKGVYGISAGAYIALMVALSQKHFGISSPVTAVAEMSGPTCLGGETEEIKLLEKESTAKNFIKDYLSTADTKQANVGYHLKESPQRPSILLVHGDKDSIISPKNGDFFYNKALKEGYDVKLLKVKNGDHIFWPKDGVMSPKPQALFKTIGQFLVNNLK